MFVHTYFRSYAIIIDVTPPIHYIVFATPHKTKYLLLKRSATPLTFFISWEITSYETKNAPRGCTLARSRNMSQATALGARMCQGTFFFIT